MDLRPLTTGEMVDRTFQLYRRYFFHFLLFGALVNMVPFLSEVFLTFFGFHPSLKDFFQIQGSPTNLKSLHVVVTLKPQTLIWISSVGILFLFIIKLGESALTSWRLGLWAARSPTCGEGDLAGGASSRTAVRCGAHRTAGGRPAGRFRSQVQRAHLLGRACSAEVCARRWLLS